MAYVAKACLVAWLACSCSTVPVAQIEAEADRLRDSAMQSFEAGDRDTALALNARAIAVARNLPAGSWRTVENYDDAGLYFYAGEDWARSARHQAIAVLLACGSRENAAMFAEYLGRLEWAFAKLRPGQDFGPVSSNPLALLDDPELAVAVNADIRRKYFIGFAAPAASRSSRPASRTWRRIPSRLSPSDPSRCG